MIRTQPLLKIGDFILINGNRRKITHISKEGVFKWNNGQAKVTKLKTNNNSNSKIIFKL